MTKKTDTKTVRLDCPIHPYAKKLELLYRLDQANKAFKKIEEATTFQDAIAHLQ